MSSNYPYQSTKNKKKFKIQQDTPEIITYNKDTNQNQDWEAKFDNVTSYVDYSNQDSLSNPTKKNDGTINNNFNSENGPNPKFKNKKLTKQQQNELNDSMKEKLLTEDSQVTQNEEDKEKQQQEKILQQQQEEEQPKKKKIRLTSLDVFRGLTMTGMILVDDTGNDEYAIWPIDHSYWFGWTSADQIFPNFLFIMGLAIPFAFSVPNYTYYNMVFNCDLGPPIECICDDNSRGNLESFCCNFEGYLDYKILGPYYEWDGHTRPSDPEGFWGYLTSVFNTFMGLCTCLMMNKYKHKSTELIKNWSLLGLSFAFIGFFMGLWIPLNKDLWTISFMFGTIGISIICLVFLYWFIDIYGRDSKFIKVICQPFIWLGMNPLFIYLIMMFEQNLLQDNITLSDGTSIWDWFLQNVFVSWTNDTVGSFLNAIFYWVIWTLIADILYD
ncbi:hypothetical protein PPERSA_07137 [Pseudocohnilembus persalinus]|uniref:Transmembrane protein n=1 Tax=Pseudocohnilembus persalinus TaxID=266149 RepID=A0A0V0QXR0_PSEPJ|nr:hypothetical protein PPERSA_07137 [Pseudocohnilembus persalinus]|eukprot:KRX06974.1 hypothetical protein PPERSA_07137 [Pseudocohnilembus persalinus]